MQHATNQGDEMHVPVCTTGQEYKCARATVFEQVQPLQQKKAKIQEMNAKSEEKMSSDHLIISLNKKC